MINIRAFFLILFFHFHLYSEPYTLIINTVGSAQYAGRVIDDHYERGLTVQYAREFKEKSRDMLPQWDIIINSCHDDCVPHLQSAQVANRLQPTLVITLSFYQEKSSCCHLYFYYNADSNPFVLTPPVLKLVPYDKAHSINYNQTRTYAQHLFESLDYCPHTIQFQKHIPFGLPCRQLLGIIAPALIVEIGLKKQSDWQYFIDPIIDGIKKIQENI